MTNHATHNHPATPAARRACRKMTGGARAGDMVQVRMDNGNLMWGVVLGFTPGGQMHVKLSEELTVYITNADVAILERRA